MVASTREFAGVNEQVRAAEARLKTDLARPDLALNLRRVQDGEKDKLKFTLIQQVLPYCNPGWQEGT
jgi:predicted nicotinamide N-methyase